MQDLISLTDWSRAQFALTAIYHWLFVPLTLGLAVIVAIMETIYYRTNSERWLAITKFWMKLFGINFAIGVATGIILEFEFGTNWSNYSWFVGDIFGAPLAIEGIVAFFMESTFIAVMFFGWGKVSRGFHLASTWLTGIGATISALWILVANGWMQNPVGMSFDPAQMRCTMDNFWEVALSPIAVNKFLHAVFDAWVLGAVFVCGVAGFMLLRKSNREFALRSIRVAAPVGIVGILLTIWTGHGSAVQVYRNQPMKLAAMEGLYYGEPGQPIIVAALLNPEKTPENDANPYLFEISIPQGLSLLAEGRTGAFIPGINDLINGYGLNAEGDTVWQDKSYATRIANGCTAREALQQFDEAKKAGDTQAMDSLTSVIHSNFRDFGYGYYDSAYEMVPPVAVTFYTFHIMVALGGYLLAFLIVMGLIAYKRPAWLSNKWACWISMISVPLAWICSQCGWAAAEVGRQPWVIQDVMPTKAAISFISTDSVITSFVIFAVIFTLLLIAEVSIMVSVVKKQVKSTDYETLKD